MTNKIATAKDKISKLMDLLNESIDTNKRIFVYVSVEEDSNGPIVDCSIKKNYSF